MAVLLCAGSSAEASSSEGFHGVSTSWPVDLMGPTNLAADAGAVSIRPEGALGGSRLTAEELVIDFAWERGAKVEREWSLVNHIIERGSETIVLHDADVRFEADSQDPFFLAYTNGGATELLAADTAFTLTPTQQEDVVVVGSSSGTQSAGAAPLGFWYTIDEPVVKAQGGGAMTVRGDFSLFAHRLIIDAKGSDGEWSEWTGYRESNPRWAVTDYELRVTNLHVKNGTFASTAADQGLSLYAPALEADVEGTLASLGVTGHMMQDDTLHIFNEDPLRLRGEGKVRVEALGEHATADPASLHLDPSGAFAVSGAGRTEAPSAASADATMRTIGMALLGSVALLSTGGMMLLGIVPAPTQGTRNLQHARWMRRGQSASDEGEWSRASRCFERAVRLKRDDPSAWFEWTRAELEAGHLERADELAEQAASVPGIDRFDLLDLRASAAWQRGDDESFGRFLADLAKEAPAMARGLVTDLRVDPSRLGPEVAVLFARARAEEVLDGYA